MANASSDSPTFGTRIKVHVNHCLPHNILLRIAAGSELSTGFEKLSNGTFYQMSLSKCCRFSVFYDAMCACRNI